MTVVEDLSAAMAKGPALSEDQIALPLPGRPNLSSNR